MEMFNTNQSIKEMGSILVEHIRENSSVWINGGGQVSFHIPANGDCSWWLDELIAVVLQKAANNDSEIIKICLEENIELFTIEKTKK